MFDPPLDQVLTPGLLELCQQTAGSVAVGSAVFATWVTAHEYGWQSARRRLSRSTWLRHLKFLRELGVPVPEGDDPEKKYGADIESAVQHLDCGPFVPGWFGTECYDQITEVLAQKPARLVELLQLSFTVIHPCQACAMHAADHGPTLWPMLAVGTQGHVSQLNFSMHSAWEVMVELHDQDLPSVRRFPTVHVDEFLRCTEPQEGAHGP